MRPIALLALVVALASTARAQHAGRIGFSVRDGRIVAGSTEDTNEANHEDPGARDDWPGPAGPARPLARRSAAAEHPTRFGVAETTGDPFIDALIRDSSARHGVDHRLVLAVVRQESGFHRRAVSPRGACGLMQLMPATARRFGVTAIFDPRQNIDAGVRYLRLLLDMFGHRVDLALAGYNAGEGRVIRAGYRVPAILETRNYVRAISAHYRRLLTESPHSTEGEDR